MELQVLAIFGPLRITARPPLAVGGLALMSDSCMETTEICHCCLRSIYLKTTRHPSCKSILFPTYENFRPT
jgi:hypothetical protein